MPDALLLVSFGGPEAPEEVMPFLERVTAGRGVPRDRLELVAEHYLAMGGISPINGQNRALLAALRARLDERGVGLPLYWGNRNSEPFLPDVLADIHAAGHCVVLAVTTSAYPSYSGCRQYRENLAAALDERGLDSELSVQVAGPYFDQPGFAIPFAASLADALADARRDGLADADLEVLFTTHSIPLSMDAAAGPEAQRAGTGTGRYVSAHEEVAQRVMQEVAAEVSWRLVFQSRSGPPQVPWLEPDVNEAIREAAARGRRRLLLLPIGFISDHMEVIWDLDHEARATAQACGVELVRLPTPGTHPVFVDLLADLLTGHSRGDADGVPAYCSASCCRNAREERPVVPGRTAQA